MIANRLLPRVKDADPAGFDEDKWEDLVEQILADDAFYRRRRYSEDRATAPIEYSRPLLRALRSYVTYLNHRNQAPGGMGSFLPSSGIVRVQAAIVTVDKCRLALDYLRGSDVDVGYLADASVTVLISGIRLGIRRAECQYLRVCDFGPPVASEETAAANRHLRIRPWMLKKRGHLSSVAQFLQSGVHALPIKTLPYTKRDDLYWFQDAQQYIILF